MSKNKDELLEEDGEVTDVLPNQMFKVTLDNGHSLIAYTSGRLRQNKIRIILGDRVKLEMSVYDLSKGRITYRN
jgi:translation initiation factor IF-1